MTDALGLAAQVRAREVSPRELVDAAIERIEATNPELNFLVTECYSAAREAADGAPAAGPFAGVPMLVKDLTETAGVRTTFSSRAFAEYVPFADASVVRRMKDAGFIVLGKSNTPEFGITCVTESDLNGACRNPWDTTRTPGRLVGWRRRGRRGRRAAARARLRRRRLAPHPRGVLRPLRDQAVARTRLRFALRRRLARAVAERADLRHRARRGCLPRRDRRLRAWRPALGDRHPSGRSSRRWVSIRVGCESPSPPRPRFPTRSTQRLVEVTRRAADALSALGHEVVERTPPWADEQALRAFAKLWQLSPALYPVSDPALLMPLNRALAAAALETSSVVFAQAVGALQRTSRQIVSFWDDVDVVLTPALAKLPVPIGWVFEPEDPWEQFARGGEFTPFTPIVNVTGQPAAAVPFDVVDGLPASIQLIGPPEGEALLFRLAAQLEAAHPWAQRLPRAQSHRA